MDDGEWPEAALVREHGASSFHKLEKEEIERLTIAAIYEHRRRLDIAQTLHDEIEEAGEKAPIALRSDYEQAVQANDAQQMVVQMLLDILGYTPKFADDIPVEAVGF